MKGDVSLDDFDKLTESQLAKLPRKKLDQLHKLQQQQLRQKQLERLPLSELKKMQQQKLQNDMLIKAKKQLAKQAQLKRDKNLLDRARRRAVYGNSLLGDRFLGNNIF